jgi:hypothetical protein
VSIVQLATVHIETLDMRACRGYRRPEVIVFVLDYVAFLHRNSHSDRKAFRIHDMIKSKASVSTTCQTGSRCFFARLIINSKNKRHKGRDNSQETIRSKQPYVLDAYNVQYSRSKPATPSSRKHSAPPYYSGKHRCIAASSRRSSRL